LRSGWEYTVPRQQFFEAVLVGKSILVREGLARILRSAKFRILASVSCADDFRPSKPILHPPLFLIVHTGNDLETTLEQTKRFRDRYPDARIAVVADHYRLNESVSAFRAGANGYFVNIITCDRFIRSMELVMMGETIRVAMEDAIAPPLSPREKLILRCLIEGASNKCIARKIDIAEATVKVHVKAILRKIRVQNRTQAAIWGMNNRSLARPANNSSPPLLPDMSNGFADPVKAIQIKQIGASVG
jgi:two-component system nitrate/nitrite response regulator NarL